MSNSINPLGKESAEVYTDDDGHYACTLNKVIDNDQSTSLRMEILISNEPNEYLLVTIGPNGQSSVEIRNSDIDIVKLKFLSLFHDLTGNYWHLRRIFISIPDHYSYVDSNDLNSSSGSEEQQVVLNQINKIPKFNCTERAFFDYDTNTVDKTYTYINDGSDYKIIIPKITDEQHEIKETLLNVRKLIVRIAIGYELESTTQVLFGSGCLLTDRLILTCAHNFDVLIWQNEKVSYSKIYVSFCDPAPEHLFSFLNPTQELIEAKLLFRGLERDNLTKHGEVADHMTDLALIELIAPVKHVQVHEYFNPKFNLSSFTMNNIPINSKLYLIAYNGKLKDNNSLNPYKYLKYFHNLTIDNLNYSHNVNHKSISIGHLIEEGSPRNPYSTHNCSTLCGASGGLILDSVGKFAGIHIGVSNSRNGKNNQMFFNKETYNKYINVNTEEFREFIHETILPNIHDDEISKNWKISP